MGTMASQITSLTIVYSTVYSNADQRKHQRSASLAFVRGIHRGPVNSPHKWPVTRKVFPFDDVIMIPRIGSWRSITKLYQNSTSSNSEGRWQTPAPVVISSFGSVSCCVYGPNRLFVITMNKPFLCYQVLYNISPVMTLILNNQILRHELFTFILVWNRRCKT